MEIFPSVHTPQIDGVAAYTNRWFTSASAKTCGFARCSASRLALLPLPDSETRLEFIKWYATNSAERLGALRSQTESWWEAETRFFDTTRSRAWVVVRRIAHTSHHRGQQMAMLRMLNRDMHSSYGPTADTGGLMQNNAPVIYAYPNFETLFAGEMAGGRKTTLPGPGDRPPTERP